VHLATAAALRWSHATFAPTAVLLRDHPRRQSVIPFCPPQIPPDPASNGLALRPLILQNIFAMVRKMCLQFSRSDDNVSADHCPPHPKRATGEGVGIRVSVVFIVVSRLQKFRPA
jgi:hypothetical protein